MIVAENQIRAVLNEYSHFLCTTVRKQKSRVNRGNKETEAIRGGNAENPAAVQNAKNAR